MTLPYVSGGQVNVQWADLQSGMSTYSWTALDSAIAANAGQIFTVQVDAGRKPAFLLSLVPYTPNWGDAEVTDPNVLMYWHPTFVSAYTGFLAALAMHLNASPYRQSFLGIRQNFNGIGTEHLNPPTTPVNYQKAANWTVPPGAVNGPDWTQTISQNYQQTVLDAYLAGFGTSPSSIHIFVRNNLPTAIQTAQATGQPSGFTYATYFQKGILYLFHTSSEIEPRGPGAGDTGQYDMFLQYALPGLTAAYAEPWADAWGGHGGQTDARWCSPPQWNYWRLLSDLNMGVSDIALYGSDMNVAYSATHTGVNVGADYQREFDQAFRFAARYAGHHIDPGSAPGAWIAFRQSITSFSPSDYNTVVTDYRRFVTLLNPSATDGLDARSDGTPVPVIANETVAGEFSIGPYTSRFGAWARAIPAGQTAELQLDSGFVTAVNGVTGAQVNITYLDNVAGASFAASFGTQSVSTKLVNSGTWQTVSIPVTSRFIADAKGGHIAIAATGGKITFHMVEVTKPVVSSRPLRPRRP
jgi:hypothetical protein